MENSNDTVKVISALIVGVLAGAALALLFAPDKGSNTRNRIIGGAKDLADDLKKKMRSEASVLRSKGEEMEVLAQDTIDDFKNSVQQKTDALLHHN